MTKKDYELIAKTLNHAREYEGKTPDDKKTILALLDDKKTILALLDVLADDLSEELAEENPRFDRNRFLKACGVEEA